MEKASRELFCAELSYCRCAQVSQTAEGACSSPHPSGKGLGVSAAGSRRDGRATTCLPHAGSRSHPQWAFQANITVWC